MLERGAGKRRWVLKAKELALPESKQRVSLWGGGSRRERRSPC
jgi:hypothetical protein